MKFRTCTDKWHYGRQLKLSMDSRLVLIDVMLGYNYGDSVRTSLAFIVWPHWIELTIALVGLFASIEINWGKKWQREGL